jgi:hypothetical protein
VADETLTVDFAATSAEAWELAETYVQTKDIMGLQDYAIGVDTDPVKGPDGQRGFRIYAVHKKEEKGKTNE